MGIWEEEPLCSRLSSLRLWSLATLRAGAGVGRTAPKRALDPVGLHAALMVKHVGVRHEDRLLASLRVASSKMTLA